MDGIVNIWKPEGLTSHDVVSHVRRAVKMKRVGHTGTLDPMAVGVLPVCIGKATNSVEMITNGHKTYIAEMMLGAETNTQDFTGDIVKSYDVCVTDDEISRAIMSFKGEISQIPPMYSAVHYNGRRLYQLARKGINVERKPRQITVFDINIKSINETKVLFEVECSKGTYIRTLCHDIGEKLGCGAYMTGLTRTSSGIFTESTAVELEKFEADPEKYLIPVSKLFEDYEKICLSEENEKKVRNGVPIVYSCENGKRYALYGNNNDFLCISEGITEQNKTILKMIKSFY